MLREHIQVFCDAAKAGHIHPDGLHILVRPTNDKAERHIGSSYALPKPISCKVKCAKEGPRAGLAVDPTKDEFAFVMPDDKRDAMKLWEENWRSMRGYGYRIEEDKHSWMYGCVLRGGSAFHSDHDLKDVIFPKTPSDRNAIKGTLDQMPHFKGPIFGKVKAYVNRRLKANMVQHGEDVHVHDHDEYQFIHRFDPDGTHRVMSPVSIDLWYTEMKRLAGDQTVFFDHFAKSLG
ncbi:MAG: hypothetical protein ABSB42_17780 [Tepidisphaeraceae bacterium]|jgi:hypothetical protein